MKFKNNLLRGELISRKKRVLADVMLENGSVVTAYCSNFSAMEGLTQSGTEVFVSRLVTPMRKLKYIWELAYADGGLVGVNASRTNELVAEAIEAKKIEGLESYDYVFRHPSYLKDTRINLTLESKDDKICYVAVNNIYMKRKTDVVFPSAVTLYERKQLEELSYLVDGGMRAVMVYVAQRMDCVGAKMVWDIDPTQAALLLEAKNRGVEFLCYNCWIDNKNIWLDKSLPLSF